MRAGWRPRSWERIAVVLLVFVALATRLPAPWGPEVIGDEMLHLESWRNRYRTADMMPLFQRRLDLNARFSTQQKQTLRDLYQGHPWFQRLLLVQSDPPSPTYSALGEVIESLSHSNLLALRLPSVVFALLALILAFFLGRMMGDDVLGLWVAGLLAIGPLPQLYAGLGRPHGLAQLALLGVIYAFAAERRYRYPSPWRFWVVALLAQTTHWSSWAIIGPLVLGEMVIRLREGTSLWQLIRQTWWYALGSVALVGVFLLQATGTSAFGANVGFPGVLTLWEYVCRASPFGHLGRFGAVGLWISGLAFVALVAVGLWAMFHRTDALRSARWPMLVAVLVSVWGTCVMCAGVRHMMIYATMPIVLAGVGARSLFPSRESAAAGLAAVLVVFTTLSLWGAEDPYRTILVHDSRYSEIARDLHSALKPGDVWISWPYFAGSPLYRYGPFPEPILPLTEQEFQQALDDRPADHACFVLTTPQDAAQNPTLRPATDKTEYLNGMTLVRLPARSR